MNLMSISTHSINTGARTKNAELSPSFQLNFTGVSGATHFLKTEAGINNAELRTALQIEAHNGNNIENLRNMYRKTKTERTQTNPLICAHGCLKESSFNSAVPAVPDAN